MYLNRIKYIIPTSLVQTKSTQTRLFKIQLNILRNKIQSYLQGFVFILCTFPYAITRKRSIIGHLTRTQHKTLSASNRTSNDLLPTTR